MVMKNPLCWVGIFFLFLVAGVVIYNLPPIKNRLGWRLDEFKATIKYAFSPPEQVVFVPQEQKSQSVVITMPPRSTPTLLVPDTDPDKAMEPATSIPGSASTPIPTRKQLTGFRHEYQGWNNCGPATLAMALSFWGWEGNQSDIAPIVKPGARDKNVNPAELANFVENRTSFSMVVRAGGDLNLLKNLMAAGFPVIVEKGFEGPKFDGWMGHYVLITGYDDTKKIFTAQDSYMGPDLQVSYEKLNSYWRAFNFTYLVIFPPERKPYITDLLGFQIDKNYNLQHAAQKAMDEIATLSERDLYFAWFNRGSSLAALQDYAGAAEAFDQAFAIYASIPQKIRPWRMLWYQTGPYQAYYFTSRYQDVVDLATKTLNNMSEPVLEESYYWRALAKDAMGDQDGAMEDLQRSLKYHPGFEQGLSALLRLKGSKTTP
jgi:hypothetical protein